MNKLNCERTMFFGLDETKQNELATMRISAPDTEKEMGRLRNRIETQQKTLNLVEKQLPAKTDVPEWGSNKWKEEINRFLRSIGINRWGVSPVLKQYAYKNAFLFDYEEKAIVIVMPMKYEIMKNAPSPESLVEIFKAYADAGEAVLKLTKWLKEHGVNARGHHPLGDIHQYHHLLMPPHAVYAGLGEQGRTGLFIDFELGSLVRLGIVTTNLDLKIGSPREKGIRIFCHRCKLCAVNCPVNAIPMEGVLDQYFKGVKIKFKINGDRCIKYFEKKYGCSICISTCIFAEQNPVKLKRRMKRIEEWYNRWIITGDFEELLVKEAHKMGKKLFLEKKGNTY